MVKKPVSDSSSEIATALGELSKKVSGWKESRATIVRELQHFRDVINSMMRDLDIAPAAAPSSRRGGRPRGYRTSAATRAKLRAAWARRKARAAGTGTKPGRTMSAEARGRIAEAQRKRWAAARAKK
jgi:hypothetical protein